MKSRMLCAVALTLSACGSNSESFLNKPSSFIVEQKWAFRPSSSNFLGTSTDFLPSDRHQWPFPVKSIGHTMASFQDYGGDPYFHHGLDIRGNAGTNILAAAGGTVVNIENYIAGQDLYWEVAIKDDDGFVWQYHHVDHDSIPQEIHDAYESKSVIAAGSKLGEIVYWPITTFGEDYHHLHLNVLGADGKHLNPFNFLEPLNDQSAPRIVKVGLIDERRRAISGNKLRFGQKYSVYATIHDLILHDRFVVPANDVAFAIDGGAMERFWKFDQLPGSNINQFVNDFFVPSLTCGDYSCRKLSVDLGFQLKGRKFPSERGAHKILIKAYDHEGNAAETEFSYQITD